MRTVVVGAGPTGLFTAIALARRGHEVVVIDRDPGPPAHGLWQRRGVMQLHHAHSFRHQVVEVLDDELPDVLAGLTAAGATIATDAIGRATALRCRRTTVDAVLRGAAGAQHGVALVTGHVDDVLQERGRAVGVRVNGSTLAADVVIDASGRASRLTNPIRGSAEGGDCGATYVTRQYRMHPNTEPPPTNSPIGLGLTFPDYWAIAFLHDDRTFSIGFTHDGTDKRLRSLRHADVFEGALRAVPQLSEWIDPSRSLPISPVLPGGRLYNSYRGQLDESGTPLLPGLISVGDAVCTTTPLAGRGVALALLQAQELVLTLEGISHDIDTVTTQFDQWCRANIWPWFDDHRYTDADRVRRWSGQDVDLSRRLPSDLIVAAADADSDLRDVVDPYARMAALPASLAAAEPRARAIYATGWRPAVPDGPSRVELAELCARGVHTAA